jgi:hypothetical protein
LCELLATYEGLVRAVMDNSAVLTLYSGIEAQVAPIDQSLVEQGVQSVLLYGNPAAVCVDVYLGRLFGGSSQDPFMMSLPAIASFAGRLGLGVVVRISTTPKSEQDHLGIT